MYYFGRRRRYR
ncbi:hypothetical protein YPPY05_3666, partial [Yersinia pestis PY-05]